MATIGVTRSNLAEGSGECYSQDYPRSGEENQTAEGCKTAPKLLIGILTPEIACFMKSGCLIVMNIAPSSIALQHSSRRKHWSYHVRLPGMNKPILSWTHDKPRSKVVTLGADDSHCGESVNWWQDSIAEACTVTAVQGSYLRLH